MSRIAVRHPKSPGREASKQPDALSPLAGETAELGPTKEGLAQLEGGSTRPAATSAPTPLTGPPPEGGRESSFTVGALRRRTASALAEHSDTSALDARILVGHALGRTANDRAFTDDQFVPDDVAARVLALTRRRAAGEPVGRIVGEREFWSLALRLSAETLEPRPDTETIVSAALAAFTARRNEELAVLDLGTGTGAILLARLSELPQARGVGIDRVVGAVQTASGNARRLGLAERTSFAVGNWAESLGRRFDIVVSNPPYIPSREIDSLPLEVRGFDPHIALDGGIDGLNGYRAIIPDLERIVKRDGRVYLEVGAGQADMVAELAAGQGFSAKRHRDLAGIERVVELNRA